MPVVDIGHGADGDGAASANPATTANPTGEAPTEPKEMMLKGIGWAERIRNLKSETHALREKRQKVAQELKAAQRKNRRLKERARCLSEEDMLQILVMKKAKSTSSATGSSSSAAGSASSGPGGEMASSTGRPRVGSPDGGRVMGDEGEDYLAREPGTD